MPRRRASNGDVPVVVDASLAVQWFAHEPGSARAARLLDSTRRLVAPDLMALEAANAWWKKARCREMDPADVTQALTYLFAAGIDWGPTGALASSALAIALAHDHPVFDCVYAAMALDRRAELATEDARLRALAVRLRIPLWASP